jgi:hypothetical protein
MNVELSSKSLDDGTVLDRNIIRHTKKANAFSKENLSSFGQKPGRQYVSTTKEKKGNLMFQESQIFWFFLSQGKRVDANDISRNSNEVMMESRP